MSNPAVPNVWYNQLCKAFPLPQEIDPVSGKKAFVATNDFGNRVYTEQPYGFCRDHNNGNCSEHQLPVSRGDIEKALNGSQ